MKASTANLLKAAEEHLARFAFFTRDNPFLSSRAAFRLDVRHRRALGDLLEGKVGVEDWLNEPLARRLAAGLTIGCVPRDLQLVTSGESPAVGVDSVHAFLHGPVFWWLVSIMWTIVVGREIDADLGESIVGYRLARKFVDDYRHHGVMFREPKVAYERWKRVPVTVANEHVGETFVASTVDLRDYYYAVDALPGEILAGLPEPEASSATRRHVQVLTRLLDVMHSAFAAEIAAAQPRPRSVPGKAPLPVGPPSSRVLANVIMFLAVRDLSECEHVVGAAAYADDLVIVSRQLPEVGDNASAYLSRLGILDAREETLVAPSVTGLATLRCGLEKSSTALVRVPARAAAEDEPEDEDVAVDPYIEADTGPEWDGVLRTVLRVPYRRERLPRQIVRSLRRLVSEIRVGLDRAEAAERVRAVIDDLDSAAFIAIRPYWSDLLVAAISSLGPDAFARLTQQFGSVAEGLVPPPQANAALTDALNFGLRTSWIHAGAQALSVAASRTERVALAEGDEVLAERSSIGPIAVREVAAYAGRLRSARLVAPEFVSTPLAEFSDWPGPLIGEGASNAFADWCVGRSEPQRRAMAMRWIGRAARFIRLHEACLAVHLWLAPGSECWLEDVRRILDSQPLLDANALEELLALASASLGESSVAHEFTDKNPNLALRFALPCARVPEGQLDAAIVGDAVASGALARELRSLTMRIVLDAVARDADVLVLPEWMVLVELLPWLMERATDSQMLVVAGQAASVVAGAYLNRLWVGLPILDAEGRRACLVPPPKPKQPLSPAEEHAVRAAGLESELASSDRLEVPVYTWRGVNFASLLCFEFADAEIRTSLRGRADVVTLSAVNHDWKYFEDAQDATTRDNYCLTVCVNTGAYPGTRIVRPTSSVKAVAAAVHGSDQPTVLTRVVDLEPIVAARVTGQRPDDVLGNQPADDTTLSDYKPLPPW
jgi:hypothetical protein